MKLIRTIVSVSVLTLFLTPYRTVRAGDRPKLERPGAPSSVQTIPLRIYRSFLPVAKGEVGGISETENFILDTGTAPSVISLPIARRLGLATTPSTFTAAGKVAPAQLAVVPEIDLGPIRAASLTVRVQDLAQLERDLGVPIAGIIGMDVLSKASFTLDYSRGEILFGEPSREGISAPLDARAGIAVLDLTFQGKRARLLVDTGAMGVVLFGGNFAEGRWKGLRGAEQTGTTLGSRNVNMQKFSEPDILVGEQRFSTDAAYLVPVTADPVFDGLLGVRALGFRKLSFDEISQTLFLQN